MRISDWSSDVCSSDLIAMRSTKWLLRRNSQIDATQRLLAEKLIAIALFVFAMLSGIDLLGIDLTALAVFSGAAGLAIGFGLQKTVGNLIAGIILLMDRSIKIGRASCRERVCQ